MDIKNLELLESIDQTHSLTMSAKQMNLTQSALSHAIKKMEKELGIALIQREVHGVHLTKDGQSLLPYVHSVTHRYRKFEEMVNSLHGLQKGSITIGTYSSIAIHWLPSVMKEFQQKYPNIQIHLREGYTEEICQWIREESVDFGFMSQLQDFKYDFIPFQKDPLYVVVPEDFQWEGDFPIEEFENHPFIASEDGVDEDVMHTLTSINCPVSFYCRDDHSIISMVNHGLGISLLPALMLEDIPIRKIPLKDPVYRMLGVGVLHQDRLSVAAQSFIKLAQKNLVISE